MVMDLSPIIYLTAKQIQGVRLERTMIVLCDTGSTCTMINKTCFPFGVTTTRGPTKQTTTTNGVLETSEKVTITGIKFRCDVSDIANQIIDRALVSKLMIRFNDWI